MKWVRGILATMAAVALSISLMGAGAVSASASASASGNKTVASRLSGSEPKSVENCGKNSCTIYHNRKKTQVLAEDLPPIMKTLVIGSAVKCFLLTPVLAKAAATKFAALGKKGVEFAAGAGGMLLDVVNDICKSDKQKNLEELAAKAQLAKAANGCLEEEKKNGKTVRVGYTTHPDWCGGN